MPYDADVPEREDFLGFLISARTFPGLRRKSEISPIIFIEIDRSGYSAPLPHVVCCVRHRSCGYSVLSSESGFGWIREGPRVRGCMEVLSGEEHASVQVQKAHSSVRRDACLMRPGVIGSTS